MIQNKLKSMCLVLWSEIKKQKLRFIVGISLGVLLTILSLVFLSDSGIKTYIICFILSGATGVVFAYPKVEIPKKYALLFGFTALVFYGLVVPNRMFGQTELFVSDLTSLISGTPYLNICILFMAYFVLLFFLQRTSLALGVEGILILILSLINYFTTMFRGSGLSFTDFTAAKTAISVMGEYHYVITPQAWKSILYMLFFIALGFRIDIPLKGWKYHIAVTVAALLGFGISLFAYTNTAVWETPGIKGEIGNIMGGEQAYGLYYYLVLTGKSNGMEKSSMYSDRELTEIAAQAKQDYHSTAGYTAKVKNPNIIFIMNEAWSDLRVLGDIETDVDYMPFFDSLKEDVNCISGYTFVNIIGGMTCNSEFEALTGDTMAFLDSSAIPYNMQVNHKMSSLAAVLSSQGYQTIAMHPNGSSSWNRGDVYSFIGFDKFVTLNEFHVSKEFIGGYVSDDSDFEELLYLYEHRDSSKPFFAFNVTIQNHSPYGGQTPITTNVLQVNHQTLADNFQISEYLSMMKLTDDALKS